MSSMIYLGGDHFAVATTGAVVDYCRERSIEVINLGSTSESDEVLLVNLIPEIIAALRKEPAASAVLVCGTGVGVEIGANRFPGIRASLATEPRIASWAREYDNANVLCLSGWATGRAVEPILDAWMSADFEPTDRLDHQLATFDSWPKEFR